MDATAWRLCLGWPWLFVVLGLMSAGSVTRAQTLSLTGGLEGMNTTSGTASAAQSFAVSGTGLTGAPVEVVPPAGYEVALNRDFSSATGTATLPLSLGNQSEIGTLVFVRLASTEAVGSLLSGNIVVRGGGATQRTLAIPSGTVEADIPGAPTLGTITPGRGTLSVAFAAPTDTGGVPILNYEYSVDDGATYFNPQPAADHGINPRNQLHDPTAGAEFRRKWSGLRCRVWHTHRQRGHHFSHRAPCRDDRFRCRYLCD